MTQVIPRPAQRDGTDPSRAADRAAAPAAWRYEDDDRAAVYRVLAERRDIRAFRPDPVPDDVLRRVLAAAHHGPSVGLMQPTRFIVIRDPATRMAMRGLAERERVRQSERFGSRSNEFLQQKIEGIIEASVGICVCCDCGDGETEIFGRSTIPETAQYGSACAIQNLWLAARAEGLGVGWVSFYRQPDLRRLLGLPERVDPIAWLCVGWPDERPVRPKLEAVGWGERIGVDDVVFSERWPAEEHDEAPDASTVAAELARAVAPVEPAALVTARDRADDRLAPARGLGLLDTVVERWAAVTGSPPAPGPACRDG